MILNEVGELVSGQLEVSRPNLNLRDQPFLVKGSMQFHYNIQSVP